MKVELKCSHPNSNNKKVICKVKDMLTNLIVVKTLQYMCVSKSHTVHLKFTQYLCQLYHNLKT